VCVLADYGCYPAATFAGCEGVSGGGGGGFAMGELGIGDLWLQLIHGFADVCIVCIQLEFEDQLMRLG